MSNNPNLNNSDEFANMIRDDQAAVDQEMDNIIEDIELGDHETPQGPHDQQNNDVQDVLNNLIGQQTQGNEIDEDDNPGGEGVPNEQERARLQAMYQADQQRAQQQQATQGQIRDQAFQAMEDDEEIDGDTPQNRQRAVAQVQPNTQGQIRDQAYQAMQDDEPDVDNTPSGGGRDRRKAIVSEFDDLYDEPDQNDVSPDDFQMHELYEKPKEINTKGRDSISSQVSNPDDIYAKPDDQDITQDEDEVDMYAPPKDNKPTRKRTMSDDFGSM